MNKENTKNVIILKNLQSNLVDEAIIIVKDKKRIENYMKEIKHNEYKEIMNCKTDNNDTIYGNMNTESLTKIKNAKKEDRKYVIKEAENVISNYIRRIEDNLSDKKVDKLKKSYKKLKKINAVLLMVTIISILFAICI